jgi:hypothetical protein
MVDEGESFPGFGAGRFPYTPACVPAGQEGVPPGGVVRQMYEPAGGPPGHGVSTTQQASVFEHVLPPQQR